MATNISINIWQQCAQENILAVVCMYAQSLQSCLIICDLIDCTPWGSSVCGDSPDKNTGVGYHALLQGIFLTQGSNPHLLRLLHLQAGSLHIHLRGSYCVIQISGLWWCSKPKAVDRNPSLHRGGANSLLHDFPPFSLGSHLVLQPMWPEISTVTF